MRRGDVADARRYWEDAHADAAPAATDWLLAEIEERSGDRLWFADLAGSSVHYRAAQELLMPRPFLISDPNEATRRQLAWSRIAHKVLYGTGPDGRRRASAIGEAHPNGCPPAPLPSLTELPAQQPAAVTADGETACEGDGPPHPSEMPAYPPSASVGEPEDTPPSDILAARPDESDAIYGHLIPGCRYRVSQSFTDFDGADCREGFAFVFQAYNYFPYDEGLTLYHDQGTIRLCGLFDDQERIMNNLAQFLVLDE
jgi:hypothetical protein